MEWGKGPLQRLAVSLKSGGSEVLCGGVGETGRGEPSILMDPAALARSDTLAPYQRAQPHKDLPSVRVQSGSWLRAKCQQHAVSAEGPAS